MVENQTFMPIFIINYCMNFSQNARQGYSISKHQSVFYMYTGSDSGQGINEYKLHNNYIAFPKETPQSKNIIIP